MGQPLANDQKAWAPLLGTKPDTAFSVCFWGPLPKTGPSSNPIKIWLDLRIWDYEEPDSLNIPSPPFDTGSISCAPTFPFPLETDILTTYTQGKAQRKLPCARTWCEQENRNWGF